jgi:hypothetical protein
VFENSVLWRIFGTKREEAIDLWRKLPNEESYYIFPSAVYDMFNSRNVRWVEHVTHMPHIKNP